MSIQRTPSYQELEKLYFRLEQATQLCQSSSEYAAIKARESERLHCTQEVALAALAQSEDTRCYMLSIEKEFEIKAEAYIKKHKADDLSETFGKLRLN